MEIRPEFWERQPYETDAAWDAFKVFRELPLHHADITKRRSAETVCRIQGRKSPTNVRGWSAANNWVQRAMAYDDFIGRTALKLKIASIAEYQKHVVESETLRFAALERMVDRKISKLMDALETEGVHYDPDGKPITPDALELQRIVKAARDLSDLQHRVAKLPTTFKDDVSTVQDDDLPFVITSG